mgnify:CR=1 FL=1
MSDPIHILLDSPLPGVRRITLNRPEKRNALNNQLRSEIFATLEAHDRDPDVRHWLGGQPNQIVTVEELQAELLPYAELPLELGMHLRNDQRDGDAGPSQHLSRFISRLLNR